LPRQPSPHPYDAARHPFSFQGGRRHGPARRIRGHGHLLQQELTSTSLFRKAGEAIYVEAKPNLNWFPAIGYWCGEKPGTAIGQTFLATASPGFKPVPSPRPRPDFAQLVRGEVDSMRVTVRGSSAAWTRSAYQSCLSIDLKVLMDGGYIDATVIGTAADNPKDCWTPR
jgi:hypothetical protein